MAEKEEKLNGLGYLSRNYRYSISGVMYKFDFRIIDNRNNVVLAQGMISTFTIKMASDVVNKIIERFEEGW